MNLYLLGMVLCCSFFSLGLTAQHNSSRPAVVNVGAIFSFNSTVGRAAKVAINEAIYDINSDSQVLQGTKLVVNMQDSNHDGFLAVLEALQFMENDVVAIIGPRSSTIAHALSHFANELQVPILSFSATDPTLSSFQYPFFVRMTRSDSFQMAAVAALVEYYHWDQVVAVFIDDDFGRNGVAALVDELAKRRCKISYMAAFRPGANSSEIMELLVKVALMESRVIVLHATTDIGLSILSVANHLGMVADGYVWIATDWLTSLLDTLEPLYSDIMGVMQGVLALRQHTADSKRKNAFQYRFGLNTYGLYAYDTVWMIAHALDAFLKDGGKISFSTDSRLSNISGENLHLFDGGNILLKKIKSLDFTGLTGQVLFDSEGDLIHPAYEIVNVIGTGVRKVGYWSNYSGLSTVSPEILNKSPANISKINQELHNVIWPGDTINWPRGWVFPSNGKELRIGVPNRISYQEFISKNQGSGIITGYCLDVFRAAVNLLPYAVPYKLIPFGDGHHNPNYDEFIAKVASNEFDAAVGDISIITGRTKFVDFTQPYIEAGLIILTPVKRRDSNSWAFLQPFSAKMWCVTGAFFIIVGAVVWVLEHRINDEFRGPPKKQVVTIFWFSFSTLFFSHKEKTLSILGRTILLFWLFVVLIIQSSYTASLTSILTVQQLSSPINGVDSLITNDDPVGVQAGAFTENYLVKELNISRSRIRRLSSREEYAKALELGPRNGGVAAVVDESPYIQLFLSKQCKFSTIGSEFTKSGWGFAFQRDSPLSVDLSTSILTLSENGDLQRIHDKWFSRLNCGSQDTEVGSDQIQLKSFMGLFLVCGIVCVFSLIVYFVLMIRQYMRYYATAGLDSSVRSSSRSGSSIHRFLSFVDEKEEEVQNKLKRQMQKRQMQNETSIGESSK